MRARFRAGCCPNTRRRWRRWTARASASRHALSGEIITTSSISAPGRLGLVLADISGKGMSAALLMANLQANLRSHVCFGSWRTFPACCGQ